MKCRFIDLRRWPCFNTVCRINIVIVSVLYMMSCEDFWLTCVSKDHRDILVFADEFVSTLTAK